MSNKSWTFAAIDRAGTEYFALIWVSIPFVIIGFLCWASAGFPDIEKEKAKKRQSRAKVQQHIENVKREKALDPTRKKTLGEKTGETIAKGGKFLGKKTKEIAKGIVNEMKYGK